MHKDAFKNSRWGLSHQARRMLYGVGAALFSVFFMKFASELLEGDVIRDDQRTLAWALMHRQPVGDAIAVTVTAWGAKTVLSILTIVGLFLCALRKRWGEALYLLVGMAALPVWVTLAKHLFARPRPPASMQLVSATGYSYPSGHATSATVFYLLAAILLCRQFPSLRIRALVLGCALVLIAVVCSSRVYLGVHYPSDVLSGFFLGSSWVLFLTAFLPPASRLSARTH